MPRERGGRKSRVWRLMLEQFSIPKMSKNDPPKIVQVRSSRPSDLKSHVGQVVSSCSSRWSRLVSSSWSSRGGRAQFGAGLPPGSWLGGTLGAPEPALGLSCLLGRPWVQEGLFRALLGRSWQPQTTFHETFEHLQFWKTTYFLAFSEPSRGPLGRL